ncbi:Uridylate kinase, partial [Haemophilus influenzae]
LVNVEKNNIKENTSLN